MKRSAPPKVCFEAMPAPDGIPVIPLPAAGLEDWHKSAAAGPAKWAEASGFKAATGAVLRLPGADGSLDSVLWGLGGVAGLAECKPADYARLSAALPAGRYSIDGLDTVGSATALTGWCLEQYEFDSFKTEKSADPGRPVLVVGESPEYGRAMALIEGIYLARDLVNTPAEDLGPTALAGVAQELAKDFGADISIIEGDELLREGFPAVHAVGRAGAGAPRLIDMVWGKPADPGLTLVGKGVCFDTGGLDLKSAAGMRLMKKDMGGAALCLGLAHAIMSLGLGLRLRVIIPAVENNVAANAIRPGDIISSRKGLTIEIGNTDAEGRLVLADALALADEEEVDLILDFATLTGAARIALGPDLPAFYTDNDGLAAALGAAADATSDPVWRMPLWSPYRDDLKSDVADITNITGHNFAGSITAALFLQRFVEQRDRWMHFDIFAWNPVRKPARPKGGEASALRAAFGLIEKLAAGKLPGEH
jgi:leucyl aminopeptidase